MSNLGFGAQTRTIQARHVVRGLMSETTNCGFRVVRIGPVFLYSPNTCTHSMLSLQLLSRFMLQAVFGFASDDLSNFRNLSDKLTLDPWKLAAKAGGIEDKTYLDDTDTSSTLLSMLSFSRTGAESPKPTEVPDIGYSSQRFDGLHPIL